MSIYQISCCAVSLILNIVLTILITKRSSKKLGIYKYLMLYISIYEGIYSVLDMIIEPSVHSYNGAFMVFRYYSKDSVFSREISSLMVDMYGGLFGYSIALFAVHFIYRYGTVEKDFYEKYLSGKKVWVLFVIPFLYFVWWTVVCVLFLRGTPESDKFMGQTILENYNFNIRELTYICVLYHPLDENGISHPDWRVFGILNCVLFIILSSMFCVFYFGFKCYFKIQTTLDANKTVSVRTRQLQQQLFQALVVQTLIPLALMFTPVGLLFTFPMLNINVGINTSFIGSTIATYLAIDPLPNMLIIRCYRNALLEFLGIVFRCKDPKRHSQVYTSTVDTVSKSNTAV